MKRQFETTRYVQKLIADMDNMGRPHGFRTDNCGELTSRTYGDYCDSTGIRREYTAPVKPQHTAVVASAISHAMMGGHTARREIRRLFPGIDLARIPNLGASGHCLWPEAVRWAAACFNRSASKANIEWRLPCEVSSSRLPDLQVVPFFQKHMMLVDHSINPACNRCCDIF